MSMQLPPHMSAQLDQEVATLERAVESLAVTVGEMLNNMGREQAVAMMALGLIRVGDVTEKAAALTAMALVLLVEQRRAREHLDDRR